MSGPIDEAPINHKLVRISNSLRSIAVLMENDTLSQNALAESLGVVQGQVFDICMEVNEELEPDVQDFMGEARDE